MTAAVEATRDFLHHRTGPPGSVVVQPEKVLQLVSALKHYPDCISIVAPACDAVRQVLSNPTFCRSQIVCDLIDAGFASVLLECSKRFVDDGGYFIVWPAVSACMRNCTTEQGQTFATAGWAAAALQCLRRFIVDGEASPELTADIRIRVVPSAAHMLVACLQRDVSWRKKLATGDTIQVRHTADLVYVMVAIIQPDLASCLLR